MTNPLDQATVIFYEGVRKVTYRYRLSNSVQHTAADLVQRIDRIAIVIPGLVAINWAPPPSDPMQLPIRLLQGKSIRLTALKDRLQEQLPKLLKSKWPDELLDPLIAKIPENDPDDIEKRDPKTKVEHLRWMLNQIKEGTVTGDKAMRFFAFVQGVLADRGALNVEEEMNRVRPHFQAPASPDQHGKDRG